MAKPDDNQIQMFDAPVTQCTDDSPPASQYDLASHLDELESHHDFPLGNRNDVVALSRSPAYTACPNPWLGEGLATERQLPTSPPPHLVTEDIREGKNDPVYFAHFYPTKVPPAAIVPFLLRFTRPGDVVLDAFCGTGMTGVASQFCGRPEVVAHRGLVGTRRAILVDIGVAPAFIAAVTNSIGRLAPHLEAIERVCREVAAKHESLWSTAHVGWLRGKRAPLERTNRPSTAKEERGRIEYTVWSDVVVCPGCSAELVYWDLVFRGPGEPEAESPRCQKCDSQVEPSKMDKAWETTFDPFLGLPIKQAKQKPVLVNYSVGSTRFEKVPDDGDFAAINTARYLLPSLQLPLVEMPRGFNTEQPRQSHGLTHVHHFFKERNQVLLAECWQQFNKFADPDARILGLYVLTGAIQRVCRLNRYMPRHDRHVGPLSGTLYVGPLTAEIPATNYMLDRITDLRRCPSSLRGKNVRVSTQSATHLDAIPDSSVDFVFTDPPFGGNLNYSELNVLVEAWLGLRTNNRQEAIVNSLQKKGLAEYQGLLDAAFSEYFRVLKPHRYIVVEFHNTSNSVWMAIQEALQKAGFSILNVAVLDKVKGTTKQLSYSSTTKQDLIITAYKPATSLGEKDEVKTVGKQEMWDFVRERLERLPILIERAGHIEPVIERTGPKLFDRSVAYFVLNGWRIPMSAAEFYGGLAEIFPPREGMYFLPNQVAEYDRKRAKSPEMLQLTLFVNDEATAIQWVHRELMQKPRTFGELQPAFMRDVQSWIRHEQRIELKTILEENFFCYDGNGPVPNQIHSYLSTNFKELRNLDKSDPTLRAKAEDRWYVPDPTKEGDLEKLRMRTLLREFEDYRTSSARKIKQFRTEAVRAGFKHCYDTQDYQTIVDVADKLPEQVIQEDEKLLMYFDVATMRLGKE
jgi:DNA modification methylase